MISETPSAYLAHLDKLAQGWPHISWLAAFMRATTSPLKLRFLSSQQRLERAARTNVSMLTFEPHSAVRRVDFRTSRDLAEALNGPANDHDDISARLFVVEDLSKDVIENLGSRFDVDPLFFRTHISDYMWNNTRDPWVELPNLDFMASKRSYLHVRYVRTRYFRTEEELSIARFEAGGFNVLRRIDKDTNWVEGADIPGSDVGLIRSNVSLWIRPNRNGQTGVLGILLVDPTISAGYPLWDGYRTLNDCPSMTEDSISPGPPRTSVFEDTIYWIQSLNPEEITKIAQDPRILFKKTLLIVCAEWYTLIKYATTRLTQLEWELENPRLQTGLEDSLKKLHTWRRRIPIFNTLLLEALDKIVKRDTFAFGTANHIQDLRPDFEILSNDINRLIARANAIMATLTAVMSIEETKKAIQQNKSLTRLTWLAATFVPLTFLTGLFSMQPSIAELTQTIWIYFAAAVPLTAVALLTTRYAIAVTEGLGSLKGGRGGK